MSSWLLATDVEQEIRTETRRAERKHGDQLDTPSFHRWKDGRMMGYGVPSAHAVQRATDDRFRAGVGTWADILVEEVAEALEKLDDPVKLREELIQVASVTYRWIRKLDIDAEEAQ